MNDILKTITTPIKLTEAPIEVAKAVQKCLGLVADGIVGEKTIEAFHQFKKDYYLDSPDYLGATTVVKLLELKEKGDKKEPVTVNDHIRLIIAECHKQGLTRKNQIAYVLATTQWETAGTFRPISEYGGSKTRYAPYFGMGYVQLTWLKNYQKYSKLTGKDLVNHPELAKEPYTAAFIMVHGFLTGGFTGKKISDYIGSVKCDFVGARRCINGTDKSHEIAALAQGWLKKLDSFMGCVAKNGKLK